MANIEWTNKEIAILRKLYRVAPRSVVEAALPRRSWTAIKTRAQLIRIHSPKRRHLQIAHAYFAARERYH
jgi:hypothetical protein